jgi:hypothetical protein
MTIAPQRRRSRLFLEPRLVKRASWESLRSIRILTGFMSANCRPVTIVPRRFRHRRQRRCGFDHYVQFVNTAMIVYDKSGNVRPVRRQQDVLLSSLTVEAIRFGAMRSCGSIDMPIDGSSLVRARYRGQNLCLAVS